jgi:hypothetical protein
VAEPADPKWKQRHWQTRYETKEAYYAFCDEMVRVNMEMARIFAEAGMEEDARYNREQAEEYKKDMEDILRDG